MKRRVVGRTVPLEKLIEDFEERWPRPMVTEKDMDADRDWRQALYAHVAEHGYSVLDVIRVGVWRQMNPRSAPSRKRPKLKGDPA
jgi:hypothetical protein